MISLKSLLLENATKVIVYHGTDKRFKRFNITKSVMGHIWFTSNKDKILKGEAGAAGRGYIISAEVTFSKPAGWDQYERLSTAELKRDGYDGVILPENDGTSHFDCIAFSTSQIKILKIDML
jgi:hypothetical protein